MNRLKELRKQKGLTQLNIEMATGIDQGNYSKIENDARCMTIDQCKRLAILFETSMDYIAGLTDEKNPYERCEKYRNIKREDIRNQ